MKTNILISGTILCFLLSACNSKEKGEKSLEIYEPVQTVTVDPVQRGEHLVNSIGCHDCHTPKKFTEQGMTLDTERLLSGYPADQKLASYDMQTAKSYVLFTMDLTSATGPWGTSFAANLTPDDSGIGTWSEAQFLNAIKKGKYKGLDGSRDLLPPMPWQSYKNLPDDDLKAIFAYLKSIKPIQNVIPSPIPPKI